MKHIELLGKIFDENVTSHVEVWIETSETSTRITITSVTSHVEVWIETSKTLIDLCSEIGHLPRGGVD